MRKIPLILLYLIVITLYGCGNNSGKNSTQEQTLTVFSAASLTNVLSDIIELYEAQTSVKIKVNYASSGTLARQITQGAITDLYISADKKWMEYVKNQGYLIEGKTVNIAENRLVLVAPKSAKQDPFIIDHSTNLKVLLGNGKLSMGDPNHVPAGQYAQQALQYYQWHTGLKSSILPAKDVRSALRVVELEEAPFGIVYYTDAAKSSEVKIISTFAPSAHQPIVYVAGQCQEGAKALDFYQFLKSDKAKKTWEKHGFK